MKIISLYKMENVRAVLSYKIANHAHPKITNLPVVYVKILINLLMENAYNVLPAVRIAFS